MPSLAATTRTVTGKKVKQLRRAGQVPVIAYGHGITPTALTVDHKGLRTIWHEAGSSQLVDLAIDDAKPVKILIHDLQTHPVSGDIVHADLYQVKMTKKLETEIPLKFVGESLAVKDLEGNLITEKDALEIRCLPADLVPEFEVDISVLKTFEDVIKVSDVKVPSAIEVLNDAEETVALVTAPRSEEEIEALAEQPVGEAAEQAAIGELEAKAEEAKAAEVAAKEAEETEAKPKE